MKSQGPARSITLPGVDVLKHVKIPTVKWETRSNSFLVWLNKLHIKYSLGNPHLIKLLKIFFYGRAQQTFSLKGQIVNILYLCTIFCLLQLFNSAIIAWSSQRQPVNGHHGVPVKLYRQATYHMWPRWHSLFIFFMIYRKSQHPKLLDSGIWV